MLIKSSWIWDTKLPWISYFDSSRWYPEGFLWWPRGCLSVSIELLSRRCSVDHGAFRCWSSRLCWPQLDGKLSATPELCVLKFLNALSGRESPMKLLARLCTDWSHMRWLLRSSKKNSFAWRVWPNPIESMMVVVRWRPLFQGYVWSKRGREGKKREGMRPHLQSLFVTYRLLRNLYYNCHSIVQRRDFVDWKYGCQSRTISCSFGSWTYLCAHFCLTNGCPSRGIVCYECCGSADMSAIERLQGIINLMVHAGVKSLIEGLVKLSYLSLLVVWQISQWVLTPIVFVANWWW